MAIREPVCKIADIFQHAACDLYHFLTGACRPHGTFHAVHQPVSKFVLQQADLPVNRRVRHVQALPGGDVSACFQEMKQHFKLTKLHS